MQHFIFLFFFLFSPQKTNKTFISVIPGTPLSVLRLCCLSVQPGNTSAPFSRGIFYSSKHKRTTVLWCCQPSCSFPTVEGLSACSLLLNAGNNDGNSDNVSPYGNQQYSPQRGHTEHTMFCCLVSARPDERGTKWAAEKWEGEAREARRKKPGSLDKVKLAVMKLTVG